jgi:hypothetical protein
MAAGNRAAGDLIQPPTGCPILGMPAFHGGHPDSREPAELRLIALKNMRNLRICHALMLLAFERVAVLGCRRVLKSAES